MIAARIVRDWKTFGYSLVISLTCWRSQVRGAQGSVEERICRLHSHSAPPSPQPCSEMWTR